MEFSLLCRRAQAQLSEQKETEFQCLLDPRLELGYQSLSPSAQTIFAFFPLQFYVPPSLTIELGGSHEKGGKKGKEGKEQEMGHVFIEFLGFVKLSGTVVSLCWKFFCKMGKDYNLGKKKT